MSVSGFDKVENAKLAEFIAENEQWIANWRDDMFSSTSRDAHGWPIEMHGLVASLEEALGHLALLRERMDSHEKALRQIAADNFTLHRPVVLIARAALSVGDAGQDGGAGSAGGTQETSE